MPTVTRENLGAWLVRCNPQVWDLEACVAAGNEWIDDWSVRDNYRTRMMEPGDLIFFWVSGQHAVYERGIWGLGHVTDYPKDTVAFVDEGEEVDNIGYWLDEDARLAVKALVDVFIPLFLEDPVTDRQLRAEGIQDLEVQIQPQGSNPSWVSKEQLARLEGLVGGIPDYEESLRIVTTSKSGAGFGDPEENMYVEEAAMEAVTDLYEKAGWLVDDVSAQNLGWDVTCTKGRRTAKIEVKGVSGDRAIVLLTGNEIRAAKEVHDWSLAVATRALSKIKVTEYPAVDVAAAAKPYLYKANLEP